MTFDITGQCYLFKEIYVSPFRIENKNIRGPVFFELLLPSSFKKTNLSLLSDASVLSKKAQNAGHQFLTAALEKAQLDNPSIRKLVRQRQYRRKTNMMKKAFEYSKMCDADVCVGIRMRETRRIHILSADTSGFWAFIPLHLVCKHGIVACRMNADLAELLLPYPNCDDISRLQDSQRRSSF